MIRLLVLLLILANLIAFLAWQGTLDAWGPGGTPVSPTGAQVAPERLKVIASGKGAGATGAAQPGDAAGPGGAAVVPGTPSSGTPSSSTPSSSTPSASVGAPPATAPANAASVPGASSASDSTPGASSAAGAAPLAAAGANGPTQCLEAGPLDEARVERIRDWARGLPAGQQASIARRPDTASYMVYLPPGTEPGDAQRRIDQLRQRGVADLFLIGDGPLKSAISLGIFRSQEGARVQVERLAARGVAGALIAPVAGRTERSWARLTRAASVADGAWEASRAQLQSVSGLVPGACAGPAP
ncbi:MAG: hypothetical protein KAY46_16615 [Burkholderiaceae bacterium]|nr:hypothetical protein [Burkholderiaceae bacterium]